MNDEVYIIVPTLNPDETIMIKFITELKIDFSNIIIVNDGSDKKYDTFFNELEKLGCKILKHYINYGKGRAIKTAINYILNNYENCKCIATSDCDGQHCVEDIKKCVKASLENQNKLILGSRNFDQKDIPFNSRYGNKITRNVFKIFVGLNIKDTQTGLRAMGKEVATKFLLTKGERYEYETNMLIACKENDIQIEQVLISTIYIDSNSGSKFNVWKDSISIYKMFLKYIFSAISSFALDIVLYSIILSILIGYEINNCILIATIIARILSSLYNYKVNSKLVFKKFTKTSIIKYIILVIIQMFVSGLTVNYLSTIIFVNVNSVLIKFFVDCAIFIVNFFIQRELIFRR